MKKVIRMSIVLCFSFVCAINISAQYKPTQNDLGKDCTTQDGKLGTWKQVRVEDGGSHSYEQKNSFTGQGGMNLGGQKSPVNGGVSLSTTDSNSRSSSKSEKVTYEDIRCVEDKNATLPQQSPVRW